MPRGGYRPGAGRPKKGSAPKVKPEPRVLPEKPAAARVDGKRRTPLEYLLDVMNDPGADEARRDRAAAVAVAFLHPKAGADGKKGEREKAAASAGAGKFAPAPPPKLVVNNR
jgi:phage terminase small subunit